MSFTLKRASQRLKTISDGIHTAYIKDIEVDSDRVFFVTYQFQQGITLKNRYEYFADRYGPVDALMDAALGPGEDDVNLRDLVGKFVNLEILHENIDGRLYCNIKRINIASDPFDADYPYAITNRPQGSDLTNKSGHQDQNIGLNQQLSSNESEVITTSTRALAQLNIDNDVDPDEDNEDLLNELDDEI